MKAELHSAFSWDCDECGQENFCRAIEANLDEAAAKDIADEQLSLHMATTQADEVGDGRYESPTLVTAIAIAPKHVRCSACGRTFETEIAHEDDADGM